MGSILGISNKIVLSTGISIFDLTIRFSGVMLLVMSIIIDALKRLRIFLSGPNSLGRFGKHHNITSSHKEISEQVCRKN